LAQVDDEHLTKWWTIRLWPPKSTAEFGVAAKKNPLPMSDCQFGWQQKLRKRCPGPNAETATKAERAKVK